MTASVDSSEIKQELSWLTSRFRDLALEERFQYSQLFHIRRILVGFAVIGILGALLSGYGAYRELGADSWAFQGGGVLRLALILLAVTAMVAFLRVQNVRHLYLWHTALLVVGCMTIALRMSVPHEGQATVLSLFHVSRDGVLLLLLVALYVLVIVPGWYVLNIIVLGALLTGFLALAWASPEGPDQPLRLVLVSLAAFAFVLGLSNAVRRLWRNYFLVHTQLQQANERLERLSQTDDLTGCANRRQLFARGRVELEKALRYDWPLSVIGVDIDHFKRVNDQHGHAVGDQVLRVFSQTLRTYLREIDVAARIGGEEFVLLLPGTDRNGALALAERLRQQIETHPVPTDGGPIPVRASFGVADLASVTAMEFSELLSAADKSLYQAKDGGRNQVHAVGMTDFEQPVLSP